MCQDCISTILLPPCEKACEATCRVGDQHKSWLCVHAPCVTDQTCSTWPACLGCKLVSCKVRALPQVYAHELRCSCLASSASSRAPMFIPCLKCKLTSYKIYGLSTRYPVHVWLGSHTGLCSSVCPLSLSSARSCSSTYLACLLELKCMLGMFQV